jgi:hypothetical protein
MSEIKMQIIDTPVAGSIWGITGNVGNGKNTLGVEVIKLLCKTCFHGVPLTSECEYCKKYGITDRRLHVKANFDITEKFCKINNIVFERMYDYKDLLGQKKGHYHQLWLIDEPNQWCFDSRTSMSKQNQDVAKKIQRCRHFNADVVFISQLNSMIDLRGRRLIKQAIFAVSPTSKYFLYAYFIDNEIIPIAMKKSYARTKLFPYFTTDNVEKGEIEDE